MRLIDADYAINAYARYGISHCYDAFDLENILNDCPTIEGVIVEQIEKKQIEYLKKRKEALISGFIDACEEINDQIKDVKSGKWLEEMKENSDA